MPNPIDSVNTANAAKEQSKNIQHIVVVGGGSAGWITAGTIAAKLNNTFAGQYSVTLVESANVAPIGVGEGTWPTMRTTLKKMGIRETDFIKQCHVSFKQGAKFAKWVTGKQDDYYYHPLMLPEGNNSETSIRQWFTTDYNHSLSTSLSPQESLCEAGLAPKYITTAEYDAEANYAYHLDAGRFSEFLKNHCVNKLNVRHLVTDVVDINNDDYGYIDSLTTEDEGDIHGDLFIDCTGFNSLLLGKHFDVPFKSCKDILFVDSAIAVQVPYESEQSSIASHTISTAQSCGWIWDIGLSNRRGVGHVYASQYISEQEALNELKRYLADSVDDVESLSFRKIPINPGHREKFWHKNCVAVGLSAGFLEPLEASALLLVEISAAMIAEQLPANRESMEIVAQRFNDTFLYRWERIIDFLKLHYMLNQRNDSAFWIDNRKAASIPNSLQTLLTLWQTQVPSDNDFIHATEVFPAASYQYVLYGMGFNTHSAPWALNEKQQDLARTQFNLTKQKTQHLMNTLPSNRALLNLIHQYGLQKI